MHRLSRLQIITEVSGPEPGYVATPIAMVQSALTVLEERPMIPSGVQTTASAFRGTSLISRLQVSCLGRPQLPQSNAMSFGGGGEGILVLSFGRLNSCTPYLQNAGLSFSVLSRKSPFKDVARS